MSLILADTSIWVDHFRNNNAVLFDLLLNDRVVMHPLVRLEIGCGTPPTPRAVTLADLERLPRSNEATHDEVAGFIEREKLYTCGCGAVDLILLASTLMTPNAKLWTLDKSLRLLSDRFKATFAPNVH